MWYLFHLLDRAIPSENCWITYLALNLKVLLHMDFQTSSVFVFDSQNISTLESWNGTLTWPDGSIMPHVVDINDNFGQDLFCISFCIRQNLFEYP